MLLNAHVHTLPENPAYVFLNGTTGVFDYPPSPLVFPFYGVHPWHADKVADDWLVQLVSLVQRLPCGIGEIGLDRSCAVSWERQLAVFDLQLKLAEKFDRPVSIHAVKSWPEILLALKKHPVRAMMHRYQGSQEMAEQLLNLGCYISLAPDKYAQNVLQAIPPERLFLEDETNTALAAHYERAAALLRISPEQLLERMLANATAFTHQTFAR